MGYLDIVRAQLPIDEGTKTKPYDDATGRPPIVQGKLSIGIGRNLTDVGLRSDEIQHLFGNDLMEAERIARTLVPVFDTLTDNRKAALINMAFNLGPKLSGFRQTLALICAGKFEDAAAAMRNSLWAKQVGARAERLENMIRSG